MPKRPTKDWHEPFLKELAETHSVDKSATSAGINRVTAYRHYSKDAAFAARWDAALKWQTAFIRSLSLSGNITLAARAVGLSRSAVYVERDQDPEFAAEWDAALWEGVETLEGLALKLATDHKSEGMLKFLITSTRARLGPDPMATAAGARPHAAPPLEEELTYTDARGIKRPVREWQGGEA